MRSIVAIYVNAVVASDVPVVVIIHVAVAELGGTDTEEHEKRAQKGFLFSLSSCMACC